MSRPRWTKLEEWALRVHHRDRRSVEFIAEILGRPVKGVQQKLVALGLVERRSPKEARAAVVRGRDKTISLPSISIQRDRT